VVRRERPELEEAKDRLVVSISNDKRQLAELEDKVGGAPLFPAALQLHAEGLEGWGGAHLQRQAPAGGAGGHGGGAAPCLVALGCLW